MINRRVSLKSDALLLQMPANQSMRAQTTKNSKEMTLLKIQLMDNKMIQQINQMMKIVFKLMKVLLKEKQTITK